MQKFRRRRSLARRRSGWFCACLRGVRRGRAASCVVFARGLRFCFSLVAVAIFKDKLCGWVACEKSVNVNVDAPGS